MDDGPRSIRTAGAVAVAILAVAAVAVVTRDVPLVAAVAGFAGTALGILTQRHTAEDLATSSPPQRLPKGERLDPPPGNGQE